MSASAAAPRVPVPAAVGESQDCGSVGTGGMRLMRMLGVSGCGREKLAAMPDLTPQQRESFERFKVWKHRPKVKATDDASVPSPQQVYAEMMRQRSAHCFAARVCVAPEADLNCRPTTTGLYSAFRSRHTATAKRSSSP